MFRYFIELAYDGSAYHGWQTQVNAHSVQATLDRALCVLLGNTWTTGCGRTDTGVHASQFYAHFDVSNEISNSTKIIFQLNAILPSDVTVYRIIPVSSSAHTRFDAISRRYGYYVGRIKPVFRNTFSYYQHNDFDIPLMNEAAALMLKHTYYECFNKSGSAQTDYICHVTEADWQVYPHTLKFNIRANRFLRGMVRAVTGTMLQLGKHQITLEQFKTILEKGDRTDAGPSVPAQGLFLEEINYPFIEHVSRNPFDL